MRIMGAKKREEGQEISFFEVKECYDVAYAEKAKEKVNLVLFKRLMRVATDMDKAYRLQLMKKPAFSYISLQEAA